MSNPTSANPTFGAETDPQSEAIFAAAAAGLRAGRRPRNAQLKKAVDLLDNKNPQDAERLLADYLKKRPDDPGALDLMAEAALQMGQPEKAEPLLAQCVGQSTSAITRYHYANTLFHRNKPVAALAQLEQLLEGDPHNALYLELKCLILSALGRHREGLDCRRTMLGDHPGSPEIWIKYAWALRSLGEREPCIEALRKAVALRPSCGEAWWSLAGLKGFHFSEADVQQMQDELARPDTSGDDRMYLHFALGKAYDDLKVFPKAFENYAKANALKRLSIEYDPGALAKHVARCKALFTNGFLKQRTGVGCESKEPIFIVGMQRAGSTLVEQILASHPAVEGTAELADVSLLAEHIGERIAPEFGYPEALARLDHSRFGDFGERYLETTRFRRSLGRPFFTDKMPYNFIHVGLMHLILPNATIIDVRRHPLDCGFSNFSMHFKFGALFAYRLSELGQAYADYVEMMAHFDSVLPGRIYRIFYEDLVREPESEIRRLLAHIGLPFDHACLRFHENARGMDSVSSEQVRRPITTEAVDHWRHYEPWLGPLKSALGRVLETYPAVPAF